MMKDNSTVLKYSLILFSLLGLSVNYAMSSSDDEESPGCIVRSKHYQNISQFSTNTTRPHTKSNENQDTRIDEDYGDDLDEKYSVYVFYESIDSIIFTKVVNHILYHPYLRSLELIGCGLDDSTNFRATHNLLIEWLKYDQTLEKLDLSHNSLNTVAFDYIDALRFNVNLNALILNNTMTRDFKAPKSNYEALICNRTLKYLEFEKNRITNIDLYINALANNITIIKFNMNFAQFLTLNNHKLIKICIGRNHMVAEHRNEQVRAAQYESMEKLYTKLYDRLNLYVWQQKFDGLRYMSPQQSYTGELPDFNTLSAKDQRLFYELGNGLHKYPMSACNH